MTDFDGGERCTNLKQENEKLLSFHHILDGRGSSESCKPTCRVHYFTEKLVSGMLLNLSLILRCPHLLLMGVRMSLIRRHAVPGKARASLQIDEINCTNRSDDGNQQRLEVKCQMLHQLVVLVVLFSFLEKGRTSRRKRPG